MNILLDLISRILMALEADNECKGDELLSCLRLIGKQPI